MSDLTLYLAPGTCAMAVHIALTEAQAHHQVKRLDLAAGSSALPPISPSIPKAGCRRLLPSAAC